MIRNLAIINLILSISVSGCVIATPNNNNSISESNKKVTLSKEDIKNLKLDESKKVEIEILKPSDKSSVEWYKTNDRSMTMKIGSNARIIATAVLKDGTWSIPNLGSVKKTV